jgi:hypothetical protein
MTITMEQCSAMLGLPGAHHLFAPPAIGETEEGFWRRKALARSRRITELERLVRNLRDTIEVYESAE